MTKVMSCGHVAFNIPIRYNRDLHQDIVERGRQRTTRRGAEFDTVLHCLQALERIGYLLPDFSHLKMQALRERNVDTPQVSERMARYDQMDVVSRLCYPRYIYLLIVMII